MLFNRSLSDLDVFQNLLFFFQLMIVTDFHIKSFACLYSKEGLIEVDDFHWPAVPGIEYNTTR
jgi:hypothetical protein